MTDMQIEEPMRVMTFNQMYISMYISMYVSMCSYVCTHTHTHTYTHTHTQICNALMRDVVSRMVPDPPMPELVKSECGTLELR